MLYSLNQKKLINYPFPILVQDNFLEESFFNNLNKTFPNEIFDNIKFSERNRKNIRANSQYLKKFIDNNKDWKKLNTLLCSDKFLLEVFKIFKKDIDNEKLCINFSNTKFYEKIEFNKNFRLLSTETIRYYLTKIYLKIRKKYFNFLNTNVMRVDFFYAQATKNYYKTIHTDNKSKIISGLFYFSDMENDSNLNIYIKKNPDEIISKDVKNDDLKSKLKIFKSFSVKPNKLILFLNKPNSYHSVEPSTFKKKRNFIYFSIGFERNISPWNYENPN
tara:strand:- start:190 stop:1014 length:825 start_codon:yes stop_codon:yes gene_type:complete